MWSACSPGEVEHGLEWRRLLDPVRPFEQEEDVLRPVQDLEQAARPVDVRGWFEEDVGDPVAGIRTPSEVEGIGQPRAEASRPRSSATIGLWWYSTPSSESVLESFRATKSNSPSKPGQVISHGLRDRISEGDDPGREVRALDHPGHHAPTLDRVAVEERVGRRPLLDQRELPGEVVGVLDARVHPLPAHRAVDVRGVSRDEATPLAECG